MTLRQSTAGIGLSVFILAGAAHAQEAPPAQQTVTAPLPTGPEWGVFSRTDTRAYLIEAAGIDRSGDERTALVARVPRDRPAGDYTHTIDRFAVRCEARQSRVVTSSDAAEDGVPGEAFDADEPWTDISANSLDEGIREIACDDRRPQPPAYDSVKAYIDAGRP